ncbi:redoxin domain-containing protein [Actinomadura madurae]|uniref:TlpA family protein disulfide reductase n=1 Tax=Actinomadura madurae TaxID=1993 RepID=UPI002027061D|nr:redoxin domain-containing protein [Actinomadura madurae]URM98419.1 redoxin domain-containing protein [Actinomadura madurae]URN09101.1 redoxin domain-containing protein [Actinomadura madurae]
MPYLVAGVVLVGVLCAFDLILTLAVVRRLREHAALLEGGRAQVPFTAPGTTLPEFSASSLDGTTVTRAFFTEPTIVGLFSTTCASCQERLPEFTERIQGLDARRVLAVIEGEQDEAEPFTTALAPVATVVVEPVKGPVSTAFGHPASPSFYIVGDGAVVTSSTLSPAGLPVPARA